MEPKDYKELLEEFYLGLSSPKEEKALYDAMEDGIDGEYESFSRDAWEHSQGIDEHRKARMRREILRMIGDSPAASRAASRRKAFRVFFRSVAVAAAVVSGVLAGYMYSEYSDPVQEFEFIAERGQKSKASLPDGTVVWLNSASRISYTSAYNDKDRHVELEGEAYFDVGKNKELPFVVMAGGAEVKAIGTRFNVRAYSDDEEVVVTLVQGKVRTSASGNEEYLVPGEQAVYDKEVGSLTRSEAPYADHLVPWIDNEINFEGQTLEQVADILERMYDIDVIFEEESVKGYSYTGLVRNGSLSNILELISSTSPVNYQLSGNTVIFKLKQK